MADGSKPASERPTSRCPSSRSGPSSSQAPGRPGVDEGRSGRLPLDSAVIRRDYHPTMREGPEVDVARRGNVAPVIANEGILGRDEELGIIAGLVATAQAGGGALLIHGDPGIG